ncbi:MAG: AlpA family phage regulatory protein [Rubrivivax sp.]|nr:AlpA family phage regulatory protein [Rubrivivax sp.]
MTDTLMRAPAVRLATGYSRSSIYALMKAGKFPKPVTLAGGGAVAWRSSDVAAWIAAQGKQAVAA